MDDRAVVVFSAQAEVGILRWLRPGFRHCFVVLRRGGAWVVIDPLAHCTLVDLAPSSLAGTAEDVAALYGRRDLVAQVVAVRAVPQRMAPLRPHTCVEVVKRVIGRRAPWVFTPWQLYCALLNEEKILTKENNLDIPAGTG